MHNIGIDIVANKRIKKIFKKHKLSFITKFLAKNEIKILDKKNNYKDIITFLAGRWAAKEAIFKCLEFPCALNRMEINYNKDHKPVVIIYDRQNNLVKTNILISISHEEKYSIAVAINQN